MLQRFMGIINDLELSHRFIALNYLSIPGDKFGEPQKDILDDDLLLLFSLTVCIISITFNDLRATFIGTVECFQL
jgi:hypothetical protein